MPISPFADRGGSLSRAVPVRSETKIPHVSLPGTFSQKGKAFGKAITADSVNEEPIHVAKTGLFIPATGTLDSLCLATASIY